MPGLSDKTKNFTESVIRSMTRTANKYGSINLSQGFPDFDPPKEITDKLSQIAKDGPHQYSVTWGAQNFREALVDKINNFTNLELDPNKNVVITCGSTEAMMASLLSVINKGDKVIIFSPFYENYTADTILSGATPIYVNLNPPEFSFNKEELEAAFKQHPKAIVICNPSNPSGKVFNLEELEYISSLAIKYDTWVITDEVYEHIVYPPNKHIAIASLANMKDRTITCSSLSKTYSITGWRLGYIYGPEFALNAIKKVHDFLTVGAAAPLQEAAIVGLKMPDSYYQELEKTYQKKRDIFLSYLEEANLSYTKPQGAYFVLVDISEFDSTDDTKFCKWLAKEVKVAAVPGSSFFKENITHLIRFHFAKKEDTLHQAGKNLLELRKIWQEKGYK